MSVEFLQHIGEAVPRAFACSHLRKGILVNERAGSLSSLGLDVLTKPNELSA
ncbi:hypothetical protein TUN199_10639, partial [Pyrenophora tritici-repentis]